MRDPDERRSFIEAHTARGHAPFVPEVSLHLASSEVTSLWLATEAWLHEREVPLPYWAFAWAGGQAVARHLLDHPEIVAGKRVLDFASGSGLVAIAAARAGAAYVTALDVDPFAASACELNAGQNGVTIEIVCDDKVGRRVPRYDVVTAGDVWYEDDAARRFEPWLRGLARDGARVLTGDPGRAYVPRERIREVARYVVPTPIELEGSGSRVTRVLELDP